MKLLLLHGPPASGKLTIARLVAARTGYALFHNHLVVDAVTALFPFGSPHFVRLREKLWRELLTTAARERRDTIFTFSPEPTVRDGFIPDLLREMRECGSETLSVALTLSEAEQDRRIANADRSAFGKLTDPLLLARLREGMAASSRAMPAADLTLDTGELSAEAAAARIMEMLD